MLRQSVGVMGSIPRLHEIATVFIRHGLGDVVRRIGIANVVERTGEILNWGTRAESTRLEPAQRVRLSLEELGPTFVKLGQLMATRVDLFPAAWIVELEKLHSEVPPVPFEALVPDLERALGRSPFEVFRDLDTRAEGSASIAQVHRAKLQDGTAVVLKVRRPGIRAKVEADLRILMHVAALIESEIPEARRYRPTGRSIRVSLSPRRLLSQKIDLLLDGAVAGAQCTQGHEVAERRLRLASLYRPGCPRLERGHVVRMASQHGVEHAQRFGPPTCLLERDRVDVTVPRGFGFQLGGAAQLVERRLEFALPDQRQPKAVVGCGIEVAEPGRPKRRHRLRRFLRRGLAIEVADRGGTEAESGQLHRGAGNPPATQRGVRPVLVRRRRGHRPSHPPSTGSIVPWT